MCDKLVCDLGCSECDIFDLSSKSDVSVCMTFEGVKFLVKKLVDYVDSSRRYLSRVYGIDNNSLVLAVWLANYLGIVAGRIGKNLKHSIVLSCLDSDLELKRLNFRANKNKNFLLVSLLSWNDDKRICDFSSLNIDFNQWVVFPWEDDLEIKRGVKDR